MSESHEQQIESIAAIAASHAADTDRGTFPAATIRALGDAGLLGLPIGKDLGGRGEGLAAAAYVVERIARECGSTAMVMTMHYVATAILEAHGGPADVRRAIAAGKHLTTIAFTEPGSRSAFWVPVSTAVADGDQVKLTAKKSYITACNHADSYVWSSKPVAGGELSSLWYVPRATPGLRFEPRYDGIGLRGNDSSPLSAEDVRVPLANRIGDDGSGFGVMMSTVLTWFQTLSAAVSVGLMETAVARTAAHAAGTQFQHAGSSVADLPTVRAFIARMRIATDQNKALLGDTIAAATTGRADAMLRLLEVKAASGESATQVTDLALRVCGGAAYRKDVALDRVFRDARASVIMSPTTDLLYDFIGKAVCGLPLF